MPQAALKSWCEQVAEMVDLCAEDTDCIEHIREAYRMVQAGPPALCASLAQSIAQDELERLLDEEAPEAAALRLVRNCGFMLSGAPGAPYIASIALPGARRDFSFSARSEATAICGAIATALLDAATAELPHWPAVPPPAR